MNKNSVLSFAKDQAKKITEMRKSKFPDFKPGDSIDVKYRINDGGNVRLQSFKGVVIAKAKNVSNYSATFTVRKMNGDVAVERKFLAYSPLLVEIEVLKKGSVRRAKLYYLRNLTGKASRIKEEISFDNLK
jgi:large subunit ribosomal protein L19